MRGEPRAHPCLADVSRRLAAALPLIGLLWAVPGDAQLVSGCSGEVATPPLLGACEAGVASLEGIAEGVALGHAGTVALPGAASTLGRRFGATPRFAITGRVSFVDVASVDPDAWSAGSEQSSWVPVFGVALGVGAFDGFQLATTVGGFLALDAVADISTARLPSGDGFDGASTAWGYGLRVGILRESFTLPGVTLSVMRRQGGSANISGTEGSLDTDVTTTSVRAVVGKELLGLNVHAGAGWDRWSADGRLAVTPLGDAGTTTGFDAERGTGSVVFAGVSRTFLVTQVGADLAFSGGIAMASVHVRLTL